MTTTLRGRVLVSTWYALAAIVSAAVAATVIAVWPAGAANGVPYNDPQSIGAVTFYDKADKPISGGKVSAKPFVWKAISSRKAPTPYDKEGRKATLLAYQPREGTRPSDWSGDTLTASTGYTDVTKPTAIATEADFSLQDYLTLFPTKWNGLLQVRMYFGAPEEPTLTSKYVTADIRVTGDSWTVVRSGQTAGAAAAAAGGGTGGSANGSTDGGVVDAANTRSASATLPEMDTPNILTISAASIVGVVLLGLVRRRRAPERA